MHASCDWKKCAETSCIGNTRLRIVCVGGASSRTKLARKSRRLDQKTVAKGLKNGLKKREKLKKCKKGGNQGKGTKKGETGKRETTKENEWRCKKMWENDGKGTKRGRGRERWEGWEAPAWTAFLQPNGSHHSPELRENATFHQEEY